MLDQASGIARYYRPRRDVTGDASHRTYYGPLAHLDAGADKCPSGYPGERTQIDRPREERQGRLCVIVSGATEMGILRYGAMGAEMNRGCVVAVYVGPKA
jgi:hypothetical protein